MTTNAELQSLREAAGAAYAAAAEAFIGSWVELHAYDLALNANGAALPTVPGHVEFLRHPEDVTRDPAERARQRLAQIQEA